MLFRGVPYRHANVQVTSQPNICFDSLSKDRKTCDIGEMYNLSIGADNHLDVVTRGIPFASALFSTLFLSHTELLKQKYHNVAALTNSKLNLDMDLLRNVPMGFTGSLFFEGKDENMLNT